MSICRVVVEGTTDGALLEATLRPAEGRDSVRVVVGGGRSAALSLACSLLMSRHEPLVLVADADSISPAAVAERQRYCESSLAEVASGTPYGVVMAIPEVEACLFDPEANGVVADLVGHEVAPEAMVEGRYVPNEVLARLDREASGGNGAGHRALIERLLERATPEHIERLRRTRLLRDVLEAVERVTAQTIPA